MVEAAPAEAATAATLERSSGRGVGRLQNTDLSREDTGWLVQASLRLFSRVLHKFQKELIAASPKNCCCWVKKKDSGSWPDV